MLKSYWTRLCLIGLIICCASLCYAQGENISHCSTFMKRIDTISGFASSGQYTYVLGRNSVRDQFINIYDVSDIMNIEFVSTTALEIYDNTLYHAVLVHGNCLFVFRDFGMVICDISQPMNPVLVSELAINGNYQESVLYADHLLTLYNRTLIAWNITSDSQPQIEDYFVYPEATALYLSGSNAILGTNGTQYSVVDVADPSNLQSLGINQNPVSGALKGVSGSNLFFLGQYDSAVQIYDASVVLEPILIGSVGSEYQGRVADLVVQGTKLALVYTDEWPQPHHIDYSCTIFEVEDPTSPILIHNDGLSNISNFLGDGGHRLILSSSLSFQFLDFTQSQFLGENIFNSGISQVVANDTHAFTYASGCGVSSINLSDPFSPFIEDQIYIPDLMAMCLNGNLLVTSQGHYYENDNYWNYSGNVVKLYDVSNPGNIQTIDTLYCCGLSYPTREIRTADDKVVLFNGFGGVEIYDISSPGEPNLNLYLSDESAHISGILEDNYLYSGLYASGEGFCVKIYDIADPDAPIVLSSVPVNFKIKRIQKSGHLLFVGGGGQAIKIFDVTDPLAPIEYGSIQVSEVLDFEIRDQALIMLLRNPQNVYSLAIYKITNPLHAILAGSYSLELRSECLALSGNYVLVGSWHADLYDCSAAYDICETSVQDQELVPSAFRLSCYPNPFREKVNIDFDLPEGGMLALDIYNVRGQKVKSLDPAHYSKGVNTVYWDAQADPSSALPAGIYILKAKSGSHSASTRIVLLK